MVPEAESASFRELVTSIALQILQSKELQVGPLYLSTATYLSFTFLSKKVTCILMRLRAMLPVLN